MIIVATVANAQFVEQFTDGGFNQNPNWDGTEQLFEVNSDKQLQLNGNDNLEVAYLSTVTTSFDNVSWEFEIKQDYNPSESDFVKIFLASDNEDLSNNTINAYFLKIGSNGNSDGLEFYVKTGTTEQLLLNMLPSVFSTTPHFIYKVTKNQYGKFVFYYKDINAANFITLDSVTNTTFTNNQFFGFLANYTLANKTNFYIDNIYYITDNTAPTIDSIVVLNPKTVQVFFSEALDETSANNSSNYSINGFNINTALLNNTNNSVTLTLDNALNSNSSYTVTVDNVADINQNATDNLTNNFQTPFYPSANEITINEVLYNPNGSTALPNAQYIELYNNTNNVIDISACTLNNGAIVPNRVVIASNSYVVLCDASAINLFNGINNVVACTNWTNFNTAGQSFEFLNINQNIIDSVTLNNNYFYDAQKANGGYSLELQYPNSCEPLFVWNESANTSGGTPSSANAAITIDRANAAISATIIDAKTIGVAFNYPMQMASLETISNYTLNPSIGIQSAIALDDKTVHLTLNNDLVLNTFYTLFVQNIEACIGNNILVDSFSIINTKIPAIGDLVINEVLFTPKNADEQFVEIKNNTENYFKVKDILFAKASVVSQIENFNLSFDDEHLIKPYDYLVFTLDANQLSSTYSNTNIDNCFTVSDLPLDEEEDIVIIKNSENTMLDKLHYYSSFHLSTLNNIEGISLERVSPLYNKTQDVDNWHSASKTVGFATPGIKNSELQEIDFAATVTVEPEVFSPDQDGFDDLLLISYQLENSLARAVANIYNTEGRLIKEITENESINDKGFFKWDGTDNDGNKSKIGIYFVQVNLSYSNGEQKSYTYKCVLASRLN
ncbi:MAG: lamin tail domain-containing protein [Chitinophagales bacterium]|nr:lamin tail domain-containing protein [Chitinophagales bacterium]